LGLTFTLAALASGINLALAGGASVGIGVCGLHGSRQLFARATAGDEGVDNCVRKAHATSRSLLLPS
jgi:hypothetical protein